MVSKLSIIFLFALTFHTHAQSLNKKNSFSFGVLSQRSPELTAQYWNPILKYISDKSGVPIDLKITASTPESNSQLEKGNYDFVYSNTIFGGNIAKQNYSVILKPKSENIKGQIVVLDDSPIQKSHDLKDKIVGFPSKAAFVAYAVPMNYLLKNKINVIPAFGGNQEGIMAQLKLGKVHAACVNSQVMKEYAAREKIKYRVIWDSEEYLNLPISNHPKVPRAVVLKIQKAFSEMSESEEGLKIFEEVSKVIQAKPPFGFSKSSNKEYQNYFEYFKKTLVKDLQ